jgi:hypothetical protein
VGELVDRLFGIVLILVAIGYFCAGWLWGFNSKLK